jgi:hypothetical protein
METDKELRMTAGTTAIIMKCSRCDGPFSGAMLTHGDGLYYHPQCSPLSGWGQTWPALPIDYDRIREIVREEIVAAKGKP